MLPSVAMFGLRIVRESDLTLLRDEKLSLNDQIRALHLKIEALHERITRGEGERTSAMTMRDMLVSRINVLEEEGATMRHKMTGLPQIAPRIEKGSPITQSAMGAQVDLFEDPGDERARDLKERGLLHSEEEIPLFPSAAALTQHLN